jgi:hypothetical protein
MLDEGDSGFFPFSMDDGVEGWRTGEKLTGMEGCEVSAGGNVAGEARSSQGCGEVDKLPGPGRIDHRQAHKVGGEFNYVGSDLGNLGGGVEIEDVRLMAFCFEGAVQIAETEVLFQLGSNQSCFHGKPPE